MAADRDPFFAESFRAGSPPVTPLVWTTAMATTRLPAWLRHADQVLARRAAVNAARAVAEQRVRRRRWEREDVDVSTRLVPRQRAG